MNYEKILDDLRQHYAELESKAEPGSLRKDTYNHIVRFIDDTRSTTPGSQRALETQFSLSSLAQSSEP